MLSELRIQNFILIDDVSLELGKGLNILTGETGAGKSIIVDALSLALGDRSKTGQVRKSADRAIVEAVFDLEGNKDVAGDLESIGISITDGTLSVRRVIRPDGKSSAYINDSSVTLKTMEETVGRLVDLHGQHEHQSLLNRPVYRDLLDAYGRLEKDVETIRSAYEAWKSTREELDSLEGDDRERSRRIDQLTFEVGDIESVNPRPGEEEEMESERNILRNVARIEEGVRNALSMLEGEREESPAVLEHLGKVVHELSRLRDVESSFKEWEDETAAALSTLEELAGKLNGYLSRLEADPGRLDSIESRLFAIQQLKRKYAPDIPGVLSFLEKCKSELDRLRNWDTALEKSRENLRKTRSAYLKKATQLSEKRSKTAGSLAKRIEKEIRCLGMEATVFQVKVVPEEEETRRFHPYGFDKVEFLVTTNKGEEPRPLAEVASGGEISRIMLAIKTVLAQVDRVPTLIFDEIDIGIGGSMADTVGERLSKIGKERQVLCITHLAAIASKADVHYRVEKTTEGKRTITKVVRLNGKEREEEIARMIGGKSDSRSARKVARELMEG